MCTSATLHQKNKPRCHPGKTFIYSYIVLAFAVSGNLCSILLRQRVLTSILSCRMKPSNEHINDNHLKGCSRAAMLLIDTEGTPSRPPDHAGGQKRNIINAICYTWQLELSRLGLSDSKCLAMFVATMATSLNLAFIIVPFTYTRSPPRAFARFDPIILRRKIP